MATPAPDPLGRVADTADRPAWRTVLLVAAGILAVVAARAVFTSAHQVIGWAVAATTVAVLLAPAVRLADRLLPHGLAIAVTFVAVIALAAGLTWLYSAGVLEQVDLIRSSGPQVAASIEERDDRVGQLARDVGLVDRIEEATERLVEGTGSRGDALRAVALSAPPFFVTMILTVFLLLFGPRMVAGGFAQLGGSRPARLEAALRDGVRRAQIQAWASIAQGVVNGLAVWVAAVAIGVPGARLVALFAGLASLVPYLGIALGWLPVIVAGLGTTGLVGVAVVAVVAIALQLVEARWWRRVVDVRSLHVGPAVVVFVAVVGHAVYGVGGALFSVALAVLALAVSDQLAVGDTPIPTPIDDSTFETGPD
ncbi:AI-2E family transporter [Ilumatobacter sp.]|uniref:AI-2E family transporter n=1 Tax=Ilumatobacter sp. TaxID=1967498 RepID=UPI003B518C72